MALSKESKNYLDSLSDKELLLELQLRYGQFVPVWEKCSKEDYEKNYGAEDDPSLENLKKRLTCPYTYKRESHWNNVQPGILWQIKHWHDKPDYYTYYKLISLNYTLMLGSDMLDYLHNRNPEWY